MNQEMNSSRSAIQKRLIDLGIVVFLSVLSWVLMVDVRMWDRVGGDRLDGVYAILHAIARNLNCGDSAYWLPNLGGGLPLAGNPIALFFYPPVRVVLHFLYDGTTDTLPFMTLGILYALHVAILSIGMYVLLRVLRKSYFVCLFSSLAATYCMLALSQCWPYLFFSYAWFPLVLACAVVFLRESQRRMVYPAIGFGALFLGLSGLANSAQSLLMNVLFFGILYLSFVWVNRKDRSAIIALTVKSMIFGVLAMMVCAAAVLPMVEFTGLISRYVPEYGRYLNPGEKINLEAFTTHVDDITCVNSLLQLTSYSRWQIPVVTSILGILGIFRKSQTKEQMAVKIYAISAAAFAGAYSLGIVFPYLMVYVPFYNAIRECFLYAPYMVIPLCLLVAEGFEVLIELGDTVPNKAYRVLLKSPQILCILITAVLVACFLPYRRNSESIVSAAAVVCIVALLWVMGKTGLRSRISARSFRAMLGILLSVGLLSSVRIFYVQFDRPGAASATETRPMETRQHIVEDLLPDMETGEGVRIHAFSGKSLYPSNIMATTDMNSLLGYMNPLLHVNVLQYGSVAYERQCLIRNVKYFMTENDPESWFYQEAERLAKGQIGVYSLYPDWFSEEKEECVLWEMPTNGLAWLVTDIINTTDTLTDEEKSGNLNSPDVDLTKTAYLNQERITGEYSISAQTPLEGTVSVLEYHPSSFKVKTVSNQTALLATAEPYYPGWNVYIDGQKSETVQVNYSMKGAIVPSGEHEVEFRYEPVWVRVGTILGAISLLLIAASVIVGVYPEKREKKAEIKR